MLKVLIFLLLELRNGLSPDSFDLHPIYVKWLALLDLRESWFDHVLASVQP